MTVEFVDELPHALRTHGRQEEIRIACRANPGKWAVYKVGARNSSVFATIRKDKVRATNQWDGFQAAVRRQPDGTYIQYVRYMPDGQEDQK